MAGKGYFITGTGTDVGKTVAAALTLCWLRHKGINAAPMKPVQTGCEEINGSLVSPDLAYCLTQAGMKPGKEELRNMSPFQYIPACSPHLAGKLAGRFSDFKTLKASFDYLSERYELVIPEGAGGILVPMDDNTTILEWFKQLGLPVIVTASTGLGTINHTLLTLMVLKQNRVPVKGIIFTNNTPVTRENRFIREDNPGIISKLGEVPVLGVIRHFKRFPSTPDEWYTIAEEDCPGLNLLLEGA